MAARYEFPRECIYGHLQKSIDDLYFRPGSPNGNGECKRCKSDRTHLRVTPAARERAAKVLKARNAAATGFCMRGHDTRIVGRYKNNECKQCKRDRWAVKAEQLAKRRLAHKDRPRFRERAPRTNEFSFGLVDRELTLRVKREHAMPWEREEIDRQIANLERSVGVAVQEGGDDE